MVAVVNTKEMREKAGKLHADALAKMEEHRDGESGQVPNDVLEDCEKMTRESANLIRQAEVLESGRDDQSFEDMVNSGRFTLDPNQVSNPRENFWNQPVMVRSGINNEMIDLNPNNKSNDDRWEGVEKPGKDDKLWTPEYHRAWLQHITTPDTKLAMGPRPEMLDMMVSGSASDGSFTSICTPIRFAARVLDYCKDMLWFRQYANIITVRESCNLGIIKEQRTGTSAAWGPACKEPKACETPKFKLKTLQPQWMAYCAEICRLLLNQRCEIDVEAMIARKLARDSAELEEEAFFLGDGKEKPLGMFYDPSVPADYCGAETQYDFSRACPDVECALDWQYFVQALCNLPQCTRNNPAGLAWVFHIDIICQLMLLTDGNNRPLWLNSLESGAPARFLNVPVRESAYAPATVEVGKHFGALADLSGYTIADGLDQAVERDDDIKKNQACWVGRRAVDGMIVEPEKISRLTLTAAE